MHLRPSAFALALIASFCGGIVALPLLNLGTSSAHAEPARLAAQVIDLAAIRHADLPGTASPEMNARVLVATDNATVGIQSGNIAKHQHPKTDEIQYIIEGSGAMWLGGERKEFKPGSLIVIPKGTAHAGAIVASGPVKALTIKIPPQAKDDIVYLN
jgi:quercetin dioxygenase-like cupin family protein